MEEMVVIEEHQLIAQLKDPAKKRRAFDYLVKEYQRSLYFHVRRIVIEHADADDVLQNAFIKAWKNIDKFRGDSSIKTWLYRIATNESLTFLNKKKKRNYQSMEDLQNDLRHSLRSGKYIDGEEIQLKLQEAILLLPEKQRLVFNMRYFDEMKYEDIANILDTTVGGLKANYHHAVKKIEKELRNKW